MKFTSSLILLLACVVVCSYAQSQSEARCDAATVTFVKRSDQYSSWMIGSTSYQIYDLKITNNGRCAITTIQAIFSTGGNGFMSEAWNYNMTTSTVNGFGSALAPGQSFNNAGFVVANSTTVYLAINRAFCDATCVAATTAAPTTTAPTTAAPTTAAPTTTAAPSNNGSSCGFQGIYTSIAFSPSTGRYAFSSGSGGFRGGYAMQTCTGYPPNQVNDCLTLLICVDCTAAISVSSGPVAGGQYVAAVSSGAASLLTKSAAQDQAYAQCSCLASGSGKTCSH